MILSLEQESKCSLQAYIFSRSLQEIKCGSEMFIFRYMNSTFADSLDSEYYFVMRDEYTPFESLLNEYPSLNEKGKTAIVEPVLHWIGYVYRAIQCISGYSSKEIYKKISPYFLMAGYDYYHSLSIENAVDEILDDAGFNDVDNMLEKIRALYLEKPTRFETTAVKKKVRKLNTPKINTPDVKYEDVCKAIKDFFFDKK